MLWAQIVLLALNAVAFLCAIGTHGQPRKPKVQNFYEDAFFLAMGTTLIYLAGGFCRFLPSPH